MFVQCGEDTGVDCVAEGAGEVRVDGKVVKAEERDDDGDGGRKMSHGSSWGSCSCRRRDIEMISYKEKPAHQCSWGDYKSWLKARDGSRRRSRKKRKKRQSESVGTNRRPVVSCYFGDCSY